MLANAVPISCTRYIYSFICTLNNFNGQIIIWYISVSVDAIRAEYCLTAYFILTPHLIAQNRFESFWFNN